MSSEDIGACLRPGRFIDSGHPVVRAFAAQATAGSSGETARAVALYYAVRDGIRYDVYIDFTNPANFTASGVLAAGRGFCVGKAALFAACCRALGLPARVGYADVRNHVTSPRLHALMQTDVFCWHSYAEVRLGERWIKATPAFDRALCERAGLAPLDFDGSADSLFHAYDLAGRRRMDYLVWRGVFSDVPFDTILDEFRRRYPKLIAAAAATEADFHREATGDPAGSPPARPSGA